MIVNDFLVENFKTILDLNFTAQVEQNFDDIANGGKDWTEMLKGFYEKFTIQLNMLKKMHSVNLENVF
jgi:DNA topoisomerase-1